MKRDWLLVRGLFLLLTGFLVASGFVAMAAHFEVSLGSWIPYIFVMVALILLFIYWWVSFRSYIQPIELPSDLRRSKVSRIPDYDVDRITDQTGKSQLSPVHLVTLVGIVNNPKRYFSRISEHVESYHRSILVRSSLSLHLLGRPYSQPSDIGPKNESIALLVPLFSPKKGRIQDGIRVFDSTGKRVSSVDSETFYAYAAAVVRALIAFAGPDAFAEYMANDRELERKVWSALKSDVPMKKKAKKLSKEVRALPASGRGKPLLKQVSLFVEELANYRPITIAVSIEEAGSKTWPESLRYVLERRFIPDSNVLPPTRLEQITRSTMFDSVRLALGVRINRVYFPLASAYRTTSYHLEVEGRQGTFFAAEEFIPPHFKGGRKLKFEGSLQARQGQRRSHLYLKDLRGTEGAYYAAKFFERAPGSFSGLFVAALTSSTLVAVLWWLHTANGDDYSTSKYGSFIPALLTVPIAMSAFLGLDVDRAKRHPSLASRVVSVGILLVSVSAFVASLLDTASVPVGDLWWDLLLWASIVVTLGCLVSWTLRLAVENHFVRSGSPS